MLVTKQSAVMMSILSESKFWSVDIIHFEAQPETVTKNAIFRPLGLATKPVTMEIWCN